jgi:hypothetical protein
MTYFNELNLKMRDVFKRVCGYKPSRTAVEIDGKLHYFTEPEIRALQVVVSEMSDEDFREFNNRTTIYSGAYKRYSTPVEILKDGRFKSPVKALCASDDLVDELLKLKIRQ